MLTTERIKELRDQTGISIMQCKKALEEAKGDFEQAIVILRKQGAVAAEKKAGRTLGAGAIAAYIHGNGGVGAMVELSCETDFVSKNEEFKALAYDIAMQVAATSPEFLKSEDITESAKVAATAVFEKEVLGKPKELRDKIMTGKLEAYFAEKVLVNQPFIKNPELKISTLIQNAVQKFGEKIELARFVRFSVK